MHWLFYNSPPKYPLERKIWVKIRFIHETNKAILVYYSKSKIWIPKSRTYKVRLKKGVFEIYVGESAVR